MTSDLIAEGGKLLGKIIDVVGKLIPNREKAQQAAVEIFTLVQGQGQKYWLPANAFTVVMLVNYGLLVYLTIMRLEVPVVVVTAAIAWTVGPLLNCLSKDTVGRVFDLIKAYVEWQEKRVSKTKQEKPK